MPIDTQAAREAAQRQSPQHQEPDQKYKITDSPARLLVRFLIFAVPLILCTIWVHLYGGSFWAAPFFTAWLLIWYVIAIPDHVPDSR